jgi:hypothetical protein
MKLVTDGKSHPLTPSLYQRLMGSAWADLDEAIRQDHKGDARLCRRGLFRVQHGTSRMARFLITVLRLPSDTDAVITELVITPFERGEMWMRRFGDKTFVTKQAERAGGVLSERFSIIELRFRLAALNGALIYRSIGAAMRVGRLSVSLPAFLSPRVEAREATNGINRTSVSVAVTLPLAGLLFSYQGDIEKEESE